MYTVMLLALLEQYIEVEDAVKVAAVEERKKPRPCQGHWYLVRRVEPVEASAQLTVTSKSAILAILPNPCKVAQHDKEWT